MTLGTLAKLVLNSFTWGMLMVPVIWAVGFFLPHFAFWRPMDRAKESLVRVLNAKLLED